MYYSLCITIITNCAGQTFRMLIYYSSSKKWVSFSKRKEKEDYCTSCINKSGKNYNQQSQHNVWENKMKPNLV